MNRYLLILPILVATPALYASDEPADSIAATAILQRQLTVDAQTTRFVSAPYASPAMRQFRLPFTYGTVGAGWQGEYMSEAVNPQTGSGEQYGFFSADAELKSGTSTLWGTAGYTNGIIRDVRYNETSDISLIYPYVTADEVGGDMRAERYSFSGGYSDRYRRMAWGVSLSYDAGLYYRNIDPRPRNTTGTLDIDAGVALRTWADYYIGLSGAYRKYRQTCDLMFMSETGEAKVYHLTGLGNHYARFAGTGYCNYYDGERYLARVTLVRASRTGLSVDAEFSRFLFDHILKDLNRLPMASAWHNEARLHVAWRHSGESHSWGIKTEGDLYRRHGSENIFGDAVTGTYPQIGSLEMYADNLRQISASMFYEFTGKSLTWSITPEWEYTYRSEVYASPAASRRTESNNVAITAAIASVNADRWYWRIEASAFVSDGLNLGTLRTGSISMSLSRRLRADHAIGISLGYRHSDYTEGPTANGGNASIQFIF